MIVRGRDEVQAFNHTVFSARDVHVAVGSSNGPGIVAHV